MNKSTYRFRISLTIISVFFVAIANAQNGYLISGKIAEANNGRPMPNATVHLKGSGYSTLSKMDGSFRIITAKWYDSLEVSSVGFETFSIGLKKGQTVNLTVGMKNKTDVLKAVVIVGFKKPEKSFM